MERQPPRTVLKPYRTPKLVDYGTLRDLTKGKTGGTVNDGLGGGNSYFPRKTST